MIQPLIYIILPAQAGRYDQGVDICLKYIAQHPELQVEDPEFDAWCDRVIAGYFSGLKNMEKQ